MHTLNKNILNIATTERHQFYCFIRILNLAALVGLESIDTIWRICDKNIERIEFSKKIFIVFKPIA